MLAQRILRQANVAHVFVEHEALAWSIVAAAPSLTPGTGEGARSPRRPAALRVAASDT